ncbi:Aste57867_8320 [Aphanomyces stellatus]|uniref:Aste57867_8320 protein n=1 Tax=Aphanomyces stellatus TaxID=120398 RepID=A0A485KK19_9STRA|nr:hypothetical protein As57867_008288 [Aphanomyces stellatus]VFT85207.1 Aste57867_8320 [Aphanomyces stellatus]
MMNSFPVHMYPTTMAPFAMTPAPAPQPQRKRPYRSSFAVVVDENTYKYRGQCKYKSGKCMNERTLKFNGEIHTLCEEHRLRHNRIQNKSDSKIRKAKRHQPTSSTAPSSPTKSRTSSMASSSSSLSSSSGPGSPSSVDATLLQMLYTDDDDYYRRSHRDSMASDTSSESSWASDWTLEELGPVGQWSPEDAFIFQNIMGLREL